MNGWTNPDGSPRRPPVWGWFAWIPFVAVGGFFVHVYLRGPELPREDQLTLVQGVATNVVQSSHRARAGTIHGTTFFIGPHKTYYSTYEGNYAKFEAAVKRGRALSVWLDTRKGENHIYKLDVGGERLLTYDHALKTAQDEMAAPKFVGFGLIFVGLLSLGANCMMLYWCNNYRDERRSESAYR